MCLLERRVCGTLRPKGSGHVVGAFFVIWVVIKGLEIIGASNRLNFGAWIILSTDV